MVPVYESYQAYFDGGRVVARVKPTRNLDFFDGNNMQNGGNGHHKGITKLSNRRYVLVSTTDWQSEREYAYVVSEEEALDEILKSDNDQLLKDPMFEELTKLLDEMPKEIEA